MSSWQRHSMTALIITGLLVAVGGFATLFSVYVRGSITDPDEILRVASAELAAGRYRIAEGLAQKVSPDPETQPETYTSQQYLIGAARVELALLEPDPRRRRLALRAALPPLKEAADAGALQDLRGRLGNLLLGRAAYDLGDYEEADKRLSRALDLDPTAVRRFMPQLVRSRIQSPLVPASNAVQLLDRYLAIPNLDPNERMTAYLLSAEAWMKASDWTRATEAIEAARKLDPNNDQMILADATLKLAQSKQIIVRSSPQGLPSAVMRLLDDVLDMATEVARRGNADAITRANYLGAQALRMLGRSDSAIEVFASVRLTGEPQYVPAASIEELELLASNLQEPELLTTTKIVIQEIGDPQVYDGTLLRIEECRDRLNVIAERLIEAGAFNTAIEFSRLLSPLVPPASALALEGRAWQAWAEQGKQDLATGGSRSAITNAAIRQRYREAGRAWGAAAQLHFTDRDYPNRLWLAIEALQQGGDFQSSLSLLEEYLRYENRDGQPRGLVARGRALMALNKVDEAIRPLADCVSLYPEDPLRFQARLLTADCYRELGQFAPARLLLEANLHDEALVPESTFWRDSLISLGKFLFTQAMESQIALTPVAPTFAMPPQDKRDALDKLLTEAVDYLETADESYSEKYRPAMETRYLAALAHRMASYWPGVEAELPDTIDSMRKDLYQKKTMHLEAALAQFESLRKEYLKMQETEPLTASEELMLRNCHLSEGDTLFDLGRYEDALKAYEGAAFLFNGEPLSLEATVRRARCYLAMNKPEEAARVYRQAAKNLERIPDTQDAAFEKTTRHSRAGWKNMLDWMNRT